MQRFAVILIAAAGTAHAHPEHGAAGWLSAGLSHLLSEPDHLAAILLPLVVAGALIGWKRLARSRSRRK
jgi:hydrogenase/urease accessory protein HupE